MFLQALEEHPLAATLDRRREVSLRGVSGTVAAWRLT
jgi:hypothetical protein